MVITLKLWPTQGRNRTRSRTVLASELTEGNGSWPFSQAIAESLDERADNGLAA